MNRVSVNKHKKDGNIKNTFMQIARDCSIFWDESMHNLIHELYKNCNKIESKAHHTNTHTHAHILLHSGTDSILDK